MHIFELAQIWGHTLPKSCSILVRPLQTLWGVSAVCLWWMEKAAMEI